MDFVWKERQTKKDSIYLDSLPYSSFITKVRILQTIKYLLFL